MFHLGWKVPLSVVHATHQDINAFAFYRTADVARFASESFIQRYITWFTQHLRIYDKVLLLKSGNTCYVHITDDDGIKIRIFDNL